MPRGGFLAYISTSASDIPSRLQQRDLDDYSAVGCLLLSYPPIETLEFMPPTLALQKGHNITNLCC